KHFSGLSRRWRNWAINACHSASCQCNAVTQVTVNRSKNDRKLLIAKAARQVNNLLSGLAHTCNVGMLPYPNLAEVSLIYFR
ncbi:hypothetical protein, partial [Amnimonas aquatica]|uniref:hypothetical protein n=1 Tax=Amnimonas aquatica TaxID=2094561 RepID=UPI0019CFB390